MLRVVRFIFFLIILIIGLSFAALNAESVALNYYFGVWHTPLALILILSMALGALFGVLACLSWLVGMRREINRLRKAAKLAETEVMNLRALPLQGAD